MKKISELFSDEEKKHLSYLGSMLRREPTQEEQEIQMILWAAQSRRNQFASKDVERQGKELKQKDAE